MMINCRFVYLLCLLCLLCLLAACHADSGRPTNVQCLSDSECSQGKCCVYLPGRYSSSSCHAVGRPQEQCRPGDKLSNYTVTEPGGSGRRSEVVAHYALCPCALGLTCSHVGKCVQDIPYGSESHPAQVPVTP